MTTKMIIAPEAETFAAPIDPGVRIGHVHLKVADIERSLKFYCGVLGFELTQKLGPEAAPTAARAGGGADRGIHFRRRLSS